MTELIPYFAALITLLFGVGFYLVLQQLNELKDYSIDCDFKFIYDIDFSYLSYRQPDSVIIAEGSTVTVDWKRMTF
jgi:hypothetical protein